MQSPPARAMTDYVLKDHKPSVRQDEARLRGLYRIFFKDHTPAAIGMQSPLRLLECKARLRGRESCALLQEERRRLRCARLRRAPRQRRSSPAGASTRSGRASARIMPDDGRWRITSLVDRNSFRSPCRARNPQERSTLSNWFNRCENCYNPVHAAHRRAEAPGYGMRSPPARTRADYFFKDHIMPIKIGIRSRNKIP